MGVFILQEQKTTVKVLYSSKIAGERKKTFLIRN